MHYSKNDVDAIVKELVNVDDVPKNETRYINASKLWDSVGDSTKVDGTEYIISMPRKNKANEFQLFLTLLTSKSEYEYLLFKYHEQNNYIFHQITEFKLCNTFKHGTSSPRTFDELAIKKKIYADKVKRFEKYHSNK